MERPPVGGKLQGRGADVRLQLRRTAFVREAEGFGVKRATPDENGQAAAGSAVLIESGVHVDDEALSQRGIPPDVGLAKRPPPGRESNSMLGSADSFPQDVDRMGRLVNAGSGEPYTPRKRWLCGR